MKLNKLTYCNCNNIKAKPSNTSARLNICSAMTLFALIIVLNTFSYSQNFINTGSYNGTGGTFKVKGQATGLPDTVKGTFEYFGNNNQDVSANNFENLVLSGNGSTKQVISNVRILNTIAVADGVRMQTSTNTVTLDKTSGRITVEDGLISGIIHKSVDMNLPADSSDFGGIGLTIKSNGNALGTTNIIRKSGNSVTAPTGNISIQRWYETSTSNTIGVDGKLYFKYAKDELAGNDSLSLELWRSPDNGITWRRQHTTVNGRTLSASHKLLNSYWTASDQSRLLGRDKYEFDPDSILALSADSMKGKFNQPLDSMFVAQITDVFGNPIKGQRVLFNITSVPTNANGQTLSKLIDTTDDNGTVSTLLILGNKTGKYTVVAQLESNPATQLSFGGYAGSGINAFIAQVAPTQDSIKQVLGTFTVQALDELNASLPNTEVRFSIIPPIGSGSTQHAIISADTITNASGLASATIKLGEKIGLYTIEALSIENSSVVHRFTVRATHGFPALSWKDNIVRIDTVGKVMPEFTYTITDRDTNAVPNRNVKFTLMMPDSSIVDSVFTTTDSLGNAKATFSYRAMPGQYTVTAVDMNLSGSEKQYICTAVAGAAKLLAITSGNLQTGQVGDQLLPFEVRVTDAIGNPIQNVQVNFAIVEKSQPLTKNDSLSVYTATTNASGIASTVLTLGDRTCTYKVKASVSGATDTTFIAHSILLYADVNHDNYRNIGDLTAMIDHITGKQLLTGYSFNKADMYPIHQNNDRGDGIVDVRDLQLCLRTMLDGGWNPTIDYLLDTLALPKANINIGQNLEKINAAIPVSPSDSFYIQATHIGTRFVLKNIDAVKGLQIVAYLKNEIKIDSADLIFPRAKMMVTNIQSVGKVLNIVLSNNNNTPLEPGDDPLFRLPIELNTSNVDSIFVLTSSGATNMVNIINLQQSDIRNLIPQTWVLYQNYPNPFNPSTTISFDVPETYGKIPKVTVQIISILGQKVATLERGIYDAGRYSVKWNGDNESGKKVASGIYFYRLIAGDYISTKKMVMLK